MILKKWYMGIIDYWRIMEIIITYKLAHQNIDVATYA
jgi:hypothetical protein